MSDDKVRKRSFEITSELNKKYPGILNEEVVNLFLSDLYDSDYSSEEIEEKIDEAIKRVIKSYTSRKNRKHGNERHYDLNEMFDCRITNDTLHIHVVPKSVKEDISRLGLKGFLAFSDEKLLDAFDKISDVIQMEDNLDIQNIFAVSPVLKVSAVQDLFRKYGFEVGMTRNEKFIKMFGTKKVGEALISRDRFLKMMEERKMFTEEKNESVQSEEFELDQMLNESEAVNTEEKDVVEQKSDNKVLVKTNKSSNEGGYGTVFGVVLVIISITFLLSGLFIRMLS